MKHIPFQRLKPMCRRLFMPLLCLAASLTSATEPLAIHPEPRDSGWSFDVAPYLWLMSLDGELTVGRATGEISVSDEDILKHLKAVVMLSAQVRKDRVSFSATSSWPNWKGTRLWDLWGASAAT